MKEGRYVTVSEMKELDRRAVQELGISAKRLMEHAGMALAREAAKVANGKKVLVFCGYGNNGGDGLVCARHLGKTGYDVKVIMVGKPKSMSPETNANMESALTAGIRPSFVSDKESMIALIGSEAKPQAIVDAIFGIGIKGPLDDFYVSIIELINGIGANIISADVPSGLDADTGDTLGSSIKATITVAFGYPKIGLKNPAAVKYTGKLIVADIGLPDESRRSDDKKPRKKFKSIKLRSGKKGKIKPDHPWIFKGQFLAPDASIKPGEVITVFGGNGAFLGMGYYNPKSQISIRLLSRETTEIDSRFFSDRISVALKKRAGVLEKTNAYRIVFSEADSLPGLIVDMYNDTVVFQALTLGMDKLKGAAVEAIRDVISPAYIYERSVSPFRRIEDLEDEEGWWGDSGKTRIEVYEQGARMIVDIENCHKTGFYLDQRNSRRALSSIAKERSVLDLFCYTGAFSIVAALGGASRVVGVDIKDDWLTLARENSVLNGVSDRIEFKKEDAFRMLKTIRDSGEKFDIIIVDPPSFIKSRESLVSAAKGYKELNAMAMGALSDGGVLATFSCSHNMPNDIFSGIIKESAVIAGKKLTILKRCHQAEDHPIIKTIPETEYLKGYFLKVSPV